VRAAAAGWPATAIRQVLTRATPKSETFPNQRSHARSRRWRGRCPGGPPSCRGRPRGRRRSARARDGSRPDGWASRAAVMMLSASALTSSSVVNCLFVRPGWPRRRPDRSMSRSSGSPRRDDRTDGPAWAPASARGSAQGRHGRRRRDRSRAGGLAGRRLGGLERKLRRGRPGRSTAAGIDACVYARIVAWKVPTVAGDYDLGRLPIDGSRRVVVRLVRGVALWHRRLSWPSGMCGVGLRRRLDSAGIVRFEVGQPTISTTQSPGRRPRRPRPRPARRHAAERLDERVGGLVRDASTTAAQVHLGANSR